MKQSIFRADAPPPGRPGASLATLTGLAAYRSRGGGIAAELRKKKGRHVLHSDLGLQNTRDERRCVKKRTQACQAEARRGAGAHLEEDGAVYDRVGGHGAAVSVKKLCEFFVESFNLTTRPRRGSGWGWGGRCRCAWWRPVRDARAARKSRQCYEASPRSSARAARARSCARCTERRRLSRSPLTKHAR